MEEQDYIIFDQYLLEELSAEERLAFEKRLESDAALKKSFDTYKDISSFLEHKFENEAETDAFKQNLETISNKHFNKNEAETVAVAGEKTKTFTLIKYLAAACVALFFGIFAFNQFSNPTYSDYNSHEPMTVVRGEGNVQELIEATKAFNSKDYEKANKLLKTVLEKDPNNKELQLYYAITHLELDNFKVADTELNKITSGQSAYKYRAMWYLALSKLKQKDSNASIALLKQIPEEADDYRQAQKLLGKLE
ncbi:tetratricopeptide repeat protein [Lacinutrix chionoecetis]